MRDAVALRPSMYLGRRRKGRAPQHLRGMGGRQAGSVATTLGLVGGDALVVGLFRGRISGTYHQFELDGALKY